MENRATLEDAITRLRTASYDVYGQTLVTPIAKTRFANLHFPKTGGTTVDYCVLALLFAQGKRFADVFVKSFNRGGHTLNLRDDGQIEFNEAALGSFGRYTYLSQHFSAQSFRRIPDKVFRFSVLRDPYERFKSLCLFPKFRDGSLGKSEYLDLCNRTLELQNNLYCRTFAEILDCPIDPESVLKALPDGFDTVCTLENVDHVLSMIFSAFGSPYVLSEKAQITKRDGSYLALSNQLDQHLEDRFTEQNQADIALYQAIQGRFGAEPPLKRETAPKEAIVVPPPIVFSQSSSYFFIPKPITVEQALTGFEARSAFKITRLTI